MTAPADSSHADHSETRASDTIALVDLDCEERHALDRTRRFESACVDDSKAENLREDFRRRRSRFSGATADEFIAVERFIESAEHRRGERFDRSRKTYDGPQSAAKVFRGRVDRFKVPASARAEFINQLARTPSRRSSEPLKTERNGK